MGHGLLIAESFGGRDGDGVAGGQQAGEDGAEKAIKGKTDDNARGRADERDARRDPQNLRARRSERQADAEFRSALRDAVSDDAEDADQRERHGGEDAKQY